MIFVFLCQTYFTLLTADGHIKSRTGVGQFGAYQLTIKQADIQIIHYNTFCSFNNFFITYSFLSIKFYCFTDWVTSLGLDLNLGYLASKM